MTKKTRIYSILFTILSVLLNIGPIATYTVIALVNSNLTYQKVALSMTVFVVLILTVISLANKVAMKSRLWVILIGLYICLDYIMTPLIIIAVCQVADELIVSPLAKHYRLRYKINKEMDLRK